MAVNESAVGVVQVGASVFDGVAVSLGGEDVQFIEGGLT